MDAAQIIPAADAAAPRDYWTGYQLRYLRDRSRFKIVKKSRRTGFTLAQSYEDVRDAVPSKGGMDVWFSSADESAAYEYILYAGRWAEIYDAAARDLGEIVLDSAKNVKAYSIEFASGHRINALSSNPSRFRSKGGKVVLDEFAAHPDGDAMWRAAAPAITWGFPIRVLSTVNGKANRYWRIVSEAEKGVDERGKPTRWRLHTVTIADAIEQGLVAKIPGYDNSAESRERFLAECRATAGDEESFQQEYMCVPQDAATAWLTWDLIIACESPDAGKPERYQGGPCYAGNDIGLRRDLWVLEVVELVGDTLWTREVARLQKSSFAEQDAVMRRVFESYNIRRACIDQTGMGEKPVEDAKRRYGQYRIEGVQFTAAVKQHLATLIRQRYEDKQVRTPEDLAYRRAHHAVRKMTTAAGNPRFDAERTAAGHADEFWAHALALHAAEGVAQPAAGVTVAPSAEALLPAAFRPPEYDDEDKLILPPAAHLPPGYRHRHRPLFPRHERPSW